MHHTKIRSILLTGITMIVLLTGLSLVPLLAQNNDTIITIAIQEWQQQFLNDDAFEGFEAANPGVDVVTVVLDQNSTFFPPPQSADDVSEYITSVNELAGTADLLPLDSFNNPRLRTRAGMYLDLTPLLSADPDAMIDDFYPVALQSMQWDNGTWGLPLSVSVQVVTYDVNAFDEAGLAYPDPSWTLADFTNAGAALTQFDDEGNVTVPGFFGFGTSNLFVALTGDTFSDPDAFPSLPLINTPETLALVEEWVAYQNEYAPDTSNGFNFDFNEIPLQINDTFVLNDEVNFGPSDANYDGSLLPGGSALVRTQGYAVSGGTANPQLAYELLQYMTSTPEIAFAFFGDTPARQSLVDVDVTDLPVFRPDVPSELQEFINEALANAIPASDLHFGSLIDQAVSRIQFDESDVATVLQEIEEQQREVYQAVGDASQTNVIEVATPVPTPVLGAGEIALTFGLENNFGPGADRSVWQTIIDEFVAQDAQVGQITLNTEFIPLSQRSEEQDCFYLSSNPVQSANLPLIAPLGSSLNTDASLNLDNFVASTIDQVTRDNDIWAIPLSISPQVMWYNRRTFDEAGLIEPTNDWTMSEFVDALNALDSEIDGAPYRTQSFGATYLYMLMAAYGGIPVDFSTTRYTFNLDNPATVEAVRQTLQLVEDGLIEYDELGGFGGGGSFGGSSTGVFDSVLQTNDFRLQNRSEDFANYVVMFPRGADYTPLSYSMAVGMISSQTPAPDACYRWLSFLSRQPEVLTGMPAQVDLFDTAVDELSDADDVVALYNAYSNALARPDTVIFPGPFGSTGSEDPVAGATNFIKQNWVNSAFDDIALEGADAETALADAQQLINDYDACTAGLEQPAATSMTDMEQEDMENFFRDYALCAIDVDPSLADFFGNFLNDEE